MDKRPYLTKTYEDVLCLTVLLATKEITRAQAEYGAQQDYYDKLPDGCSSCPHKDVCLACIINE